MDIFEKLNRQQVLIQKQVFKTLQRRLMLACHQHKNESDWQRYFAGMLECENYQAIVNAIRLLKIREADKNKLLYWLDIAQYKTVQQAEIADSQTFYLGG